MLFITSIAQTDPENLSLERVKVLKLKEVENYSIAKYLQLRSRDRDFGKQQKSQELEIHAKRKEKERIQLETKRETVRNARILRKARSASIQQELLRKNKQIAGNIRDYMDKIKNSKKYYSPVLKRYSNPTLQQNQLFSVHRENKILSGIQNKIRELRALEVRLRSRSLAKY